MSASNSLKKIESYHQAHSAQPGQKMPPFMNLILPPLSAIQNSPQKFKNSNTNLNTAGGNDEKMHLTIYLKSGKDKSPTQQKQKKNNQNAQHYHSKHRPHGSITSCGQLIPQDPTLKSNTSSRQIKEDSESFQQFEQYQLSLTQETNTTTVDQDQSAQLSVFNNIFLEDSSNPKAHKLIHKQSKADRFIPNRKISNLLVDSEPRIESESSPRSSVLPFYENSVLRIPNRTQQQSQQLQFKNCNALKFKENVPEQKMENIDPIAQYQPYILSQCGIYTDPQM